jgi:Ca2+-binding EF-hand superfamily protein
MRAIGVIAAGLVLALGGAAGAEGVPAKLARRLASNPEGVKAAAGDLIHGHGTDGAIDRAGILQALALDRAAARARALVPLTAADLDGDGQVTAPEMAAVARAADAAYRGRLMRAFEAADDDGNGSVTGPEAMAYARAEGVRQVDAADEARLLALLTLDQNGDGRLTLAEVEAAALQASVSAKAAAPADKDA